MWLEDRAYEDTLMPHHCFFINVNQTAAGAQKVSMSCCFLHLSFSNFFHILFSLEC